MPCLWGGVYICRLLVLLLKKVFWEVNLDLTAKSKTEFLYAFGVAPFFQKSVRERSKAENRIIVTQYLQIMLIVEQQRICCRLLIKSRFLYDIVYNIPDCV